jgi:histone-lysine N-methyltransferase SETMAR
MKLLWSISTTKKNSARWVPQVLTEEHKSKHMGAALAFSEHYHQEGNNFLDQIITGHETWVSHIIPESKCLSPEWDHSHSPSKLKKFKQTSTRKVLATVFLGQEGVLLVEFMPKGQTFNAASYCATLKQLRRAIQNHWQGQLSTGVVLLDDNAHLHTAASTHALLTDFAWDVFFHPLYSLNLAQSDFHLFTHLKQFLGGTRMGSDEEGMKMVRDKLNGLVADFYNAGIQKLIT